jgi:ribosomal protein S18 acetylase RimI-like enzyme
MKVSIREATRKDATLIADISRSTFYETFAADNAVEDMNIFLEQQFTRGRLMLEVGRAENIFLLAYLGEVVAGYVKLRNGRPPTALGTGNAMEIARLYAVTSQIGKGIGSALMQAAIEKAIEKQKETVWLGVWEKNQRAIDFYTRWGFEKFGETDFILGNDVQVDWLMKRQL